MKKLSSLLVLLFIATVSSARPATMESARTVNQGQAAPASGAWPVYIAPTTSSGSGASEIATSQLATFLVVKPTPGNLYHFDVTTGGVGGYVLIHNSTTKPVAGTVAPLKCYKVAANSSVQDTWSPGASYSTGIVITFSTASCFTQADSETVFISADYQ